MKPSTQATQKDTTENKDNWIVHGFAWDPHCIIS
ncbi:LAFE_0G12332g1_1 [Lachancea fermentati]|uniref:LAFE_0G12332g1_1 n=1 Tax=Lachancea fermentati TaxID=4955 RepID=A0A1G4MIE6_LACFM|nr:LAFE_0G12332g1_1 [Lachancea fermentati]